MPRSAAFLAVLLFAAMPHAVADQQFSLVSPEWVAEHASDVNVRVLDVRADAAAYFAGHVPNAVNISDQALRGPKEGIPVQYLPLEIGAQLLSRAGVRDGQTVVVYADGKDVPAAAMVAYVLEKMGHKDVRIMDGGWSVYKASQLASQAYPSYVPAELSIAENRSIYVTLDEVRKALGDPAIKFVDARPSGAYAGTINTWMRNGHIPGAVNVDWQSLMTAENIHKFLPTEKMQAIFDEKGVLKTDNIIVYCGTSREASLEYAVLKHLLGYPNVRLYEGSWTEYSAQADLPMTTGAAP